MYIALSVLASAVFGYTASVAYGWAGLFITLPMAIGLGLVAAIAQRRWP